LVYNYKAIKKTEVKMCKILVAEDEANLLKLITSYLEREGFYVSQARDGFEALQFFADGQYNLVILDIMMPKIDGLSVCKKMRETSDVPIIFLTSRSQEYDELSGFAHGADEYITKPFSPAILVTRVKNLLKRSGNIKQEKINFRILEINKNTHTVTMDGIEIALTPKEFDLLIYMILNKNIVLSRDRLLENVWGYDYDGDDRTVDTHIKCLRNKLYLCKDYIKTVSKIGYTIK